MCGQQNRRKISKCCHSVSVWTELIFPETMISLPPLLYCNLNHTAMYCTYTVNEHNITTITSVSWILRLNCIHYIIINCHIYADKTPSQHLIHL